MITVIDTHLYLSSSNVVLKHGAIKFSYSKDQYHDLALISSTLLSNEYGVRILLN